MLDTKFLWAIRERSHDEVAEILDQRPKAANAIDPDGKTPLMYLALEWMEGDEKLVAWLVDAGAKVNVSDFKGGDTALHLACRNRNARFIEALHAATRGRTELHYYIENFAGETAVGLAERIGDYKVLKAVTSGRFSKIKPGEVATRIAVVGVGPAGAALFISLVRRLVFEQKRRGTPLEAMRIVLIDRHAVLGTGTPYSAEKNAPTSLLNIAAGGMSIVHGKPDDFYDWLQEKEEQKTLVKLLGPACQLGLCPGHADRSAYYPRLTYGHYLAERVDQYICQAETSGIKVDVLPLTEVIHDLPGEDGQSRLLLLKGKSGKQKLNVTNVYYATGHWVQKPDEESQYKQSDRYIPFPANVKLLKSKGVFQDDHHIAVLGSSLSAIDAVFSILLHPDVGHLERDKNGLPTYVRHENFRNFKVTCYSRRGLLPRVRPLTNRDYSLAFLTPERFSRWQAARGGHVSLKEVIKAFNWEFSLAFGRKIDVLKESDPLQFSGSLEHNKDPFKVVYSDLQKAHFGDGGDDTGYVRWYQVMHALFPVIRMIYRQFTTEERKRFDHGYNSRFLWAFAPMPHTSAEVLLAMHVAGALDVRRVKGAPFIDGEGIALRSLTPQDKEEWVWHPFLIGTTGLANVFYRDVSPLTRNLMETGAFDFRDPMTDVEDVSAFMSDDGSFEILDVFGHHSPMRRGVGFFLHAQLFDVQAVPSVVRYGGHVAKIYSDEYHYRLYGDKINEPYRHLENLDSLIRLLSASNMRPKL